MGSVVLLSGGIDSSTCAALEAERGRLMACLFVDYGQPVAPSERTAAVAVAAALGCPLHFASLSIALGAMADAPGVPGPRVVPGRNLTLASLAVSLALTIGAEDVILGATAGDAAAYRDCRLGFIRRLSETVRKTYGLRIEAPLVQADKAGVVAEARRLGLDLSLTWSCYAPNDGHPCGTCNACVERRDAMGGA